MKLFNSEFNSLNDLFVEQIEDIYDAENRLTQALPKMSEAANSIELKDAFDAHLVETEGHLARLDNIFRQMGIEPKRETCAAMKGLISEGETMIKASGDPDVKDAALIAAAQRVEHYEIATYGSLRAFALRLGFNQPANLLQQTLQEESAADEKLTQIAESSVNVLASSKAV